MRDEAARRPVEVDRAAAAPKETAVHEVPDGQESGARAWAGEAIAPPPIVDEPDDEVTDGAPDRS